MPTKKRNEPPQKRSFNDQVYWLVRQIPRGRVLSYGRVAGFLNVPQGARAVGWALHNLAETTDVPWQRVINAQGYVSIRSVDGAATRQRELLEAEGVIFDEYERVNLGQFLWMPSEWELRALLDSENAEVTSEV